ncbi:ADARB2 [Cordylochernes scorpioides]|uniref:ADARB2 n=1 Tax=Cordylochernes scorpioides TaxID=51811 RepID=A0ABY6KDZ5_9ARAC|nr:ADARB2 [Cordylochernes scorpioides]
MEVGPPLKRKATEDGPKKRKKRATQSNMVKTPLMQLNELKPGLVFTVDGQEGLPHEPIFLVSVEVNNQKFHGRGPSKQQAKHAAANEALKSFVQFQDMADVGRSVANSIACWDFTSDIVDNEQAIFNKFEKNGSSKMEISPEPKTEDPKPPQVRTDIVSKHPVMLLNELYPGSYYELLKEHPNHPGQRFTMKVTVGDKIFEGSGTNKKLAKAAAARAAICEILKVNYSATESPTVTDEVHNLPQTIADNIARAIYDKFNQIMEGNPNQAKWKVLAGIAMTTDPEMKDITVVCVTTGTKCINGGHISMNGASLNDCHAEIISRRCFKSYLYSQLELLTGSSAQDSIFIKEDNWYGLKPNVKFHLFISTSPCGDARIFCPKEDHVDKHPNRKARGVLRTKIESGEGTIPVKDVNPIQTWDGIIHGQQRLLTMSCSDKIAAWNVIGLQGALLSHFIRPIYLESIILGSLFNLSHMVRAMWGRLENVAPQLPPPYQVNQPKLCCTTSPVGRHLVKSPNFSINWVVEQANPEVINAITGKTESGQNSHICKRSLFHRFQQLCTLLPGYASLSTNKPYSEAKAEVEVYQEVKEKFIHIFPHNNLGYWVKKPAEQDDDKSRFLLCPDDRRKRIWRRPGQRVDPGLTVEHHTGPQQGVMVWGAISFDNRTPLVVIPGTLTAQRYVDDIQRPVLLPFLSHHPGLTFQQDNAQPHTARVTMDCLQSCRTLPWPARSPDLSSIEHIWDVMGRRLQPSRNVDYLARKLETIWQEIPQYTIRNLYQSMTRRVRNYFVQHLPRNPSIFSGEGGEDLPKWLKGYARVARYNHWDETLCLTKVYFYLSGTALKWFESNEESIQTWKTFTSQLENVFGKKENSKLQAEKKLKTRAQLKGESTEFYIQDVLCLCKEVDPQMSKEDKISHLMKGIAEELYQALLPRNVQSTEKFITECRRVEALHRRRVTPTRYECLPNVASLCD